MISQDAIESLPLGERIKLQTFKKKTKPETSAGPKKRANKNRPREMSSKRPVVDPATFERPRRANKRNIDPRFDSLYGDYDEKTFRNDYGHLVDELKTRDKTTLGKMLKKEKNPEQQQKLTHTLKRIADRERELERVKALRQKVALEKTRTVEALSKGQPARFKTKTEIKLGELVNKFGTLKEKGKLLKYMKKKNKSKSQPQF